LTLNQLVLGSSPSRGTIFPLENESTCKATKDSLNISEEFPEECAIVVKFPKRLRYRDRGKPLATIYKRPGQSQPYRLYWRARVDGKPRTHFRDFSTYSAAKKAGDKVVADRAKGSQAMELSPGQASDALAAFQRLQDYYVRTGRRISLL